MDFYNNNGDNKDSITEFIINFVTKNHKKIKVGLFCGASFLSGTWLGSFISTKKKAAKDSKKENDFNGLL